MLSGVASHPKLLSYLLFLLSGSIALPMLPVWQGGVRLLACVTLLSLACYSRLLNRLIGGIFLLCFFISLFYWFDSLLSSPGAHIIASLTDVFGQPLGVWPDSLLLVLDVICISGLFLLIKQSARRIAEPTIMFFSVGLIAFWSIALFSVTSLGLTVESARLSQMITGLSGWATWIYWAFLAILLVRDEEAIMSVLKAIAIGCVMVATVVLIQWVLKDFSYVIGNVLDASGVFTRARGTYFYHAPATLIITLGGLVFFGLYRFYGYIGLLFAALALTGISLLNNTRGISLALLVGLFFILASAVYKRQWILSVCVLTVVGITIPNVFYLKPQVEEIVSEADSAQIYTANKPRALLAGEGLRQLESIPLTGHGVGTLDLELEGDTFNGLLSTNSSHVLYFDIALMAGIASLAGLIFALLISIYCLLMRSFQQANFIKNSHEICVTLLALLSVFAVAGVFLPQERNELIGIAFFISGLAVCIGMTNKASSNVVLSSGMFVVGKLNYLLAIAVLGWVVLSSPTYVFPALELTQLYGKEIVKEEQHVYVAEPIVQKILGMLIAARGGQSSQVSILLDEPENLHDDGSWIVWSPTRWENYPKLVDQLVSSKFPYQTKSLNLPLLPQWWLMPSAQPVASFIYSGVREDMAIHFAYPRSPVDSISDNASQYQLQQTISKFNSYTLRLFFTEAGDMQQIEMPSSIAYDDKIELLAGMDLSQGFELFIYPRVNPNQSPYANIEASDNVVPTVDTLSNVADYNYGTGVQWDMMEAATIQFELYGSKDQLLRSYRLTAIPFRNASRADFYNWVLEGTNDNVEWVEIDRQYNQHVSQDGKSPSAFITSVNDSYKYYRFRFPPGESEVAFIAGFTEIELYFSPSS